MSYKFNTSVKIGCGKVDGVRWLKDSKINGNQWNTQSQCAPKTLPLEADIFDLC